jgi:hypothetical protein
MTTLIESTTIPTKKKQFSLLLQILNQQLKHVLQGELQWLLITKLLVFRWFTTTKEEFHKLK